MTITQLEQTLIDNALAHQAALAAYYRRYQAGVFNEDDHAEYLMHAGSLTDLVSLSRFKSGLSDSAAEQLRHVEMEDASSFRLHFPVEEEGLEGASPDHAPVDGRDPGRLVKPFFHQINSYVRSR